MGQIACMAGMPYGAMPPPAIPETEMNLGMRDRLVNNRRL
ncbi:hypothetical protein HMPREF9946_00339 [Acetobacteraceae bacterium AT-5844]|nr:hypothetical protein HMPREF9946_00339 [Acetobacteraceae bacterium AT-5844]